MDSALLARLKGIREAKTASPLWLYLLIYSKARRECYINYNHGSKVLLAYLTEEGSVPLDYEVAKHPEIEDKNFKVPSLLGGYEAGELSKILTASEENKGIDKRLTAMKKADRAIYITMVQKVSQLT